MGKVRSGQVKRLSEQLAEKYPGSFSTDFDSNKSILNSFGLPMTKKMRNKIAGYVTQIKKLETRPAIAQLEEEPAEQQ